MVKGRCMKCGEELDRKGYVCKLCKLKTDIRNQVKQKEELKIIRQQFLEQRPQIYEEIRKKVLEELEND